MSLPENPNDGDVYQLENGVVLVYEAFTSSWTQISTGLQPIRLADEFLPGALSKEDLAKLDNLIIPPYKTSLASDFCNITFNQGAVSLQSVDGYVEISSEPYTGNIDNNGLLISSNLPFQIHDYTYGIDFNLNLPKFIADQQALGKVKFKGLDGITGDTGNQGEQGISRVYSGPAGDTGDIGDGIVSSYSVSAEPFQVSQRVSDGKAITRAEIVPDAADPTKRKINFVRQLVGSTNPASKLKVSSNTSPWLLAVENQNASNQKIYYIDIDPILDTIYDVYIGEVEALKAAYEGVVKSWVSQMSGLFDQQKAALCCALDKCISMKKNTERRSHMEDVAAAALGKAKIVLRSRHDPDAVKISGTFSLGEMGYEDVGASTSTGTFPQNPSYGSSNSGGSVVTAPQKATMALTSVSESRILHHIHINAENNNSLLTSYKYDLPAGEYIAKIVVARAKSEDTYRSNIKVLYRRDLKKYIDEFPFKGAFKAEADARDLYEGQAISIKHSGGMTEWWLPAEMGVLTSGRVDIEISEAAEIPIAHKVGYCTLQAIKVSWYQKAWRNRECCGCVINIMGQDYIIIRKSVGDDLSCGGGEDASSDCFSVFRRFGSPAFAFPTYDGSSFLGERNDITYKLDDQLNSLALDLIKQGKYFKAVGFQDFDMILFPTVE